MPTPAELQSEAKANLNAFTNGLISKRDNESAQLDWVATFKKYHDLIKSLFAAYNFSIPSLPVFKKFDEFSALKGTLTKSLVLQQIIPLLKNGLELVKPIIGQNQDALDFFATASNALADQINNTLPAKTSSISSQLKFSINPPPIARTTTPTPQNHVALQVPPTPVATMVH